MQVPLDKTYCSVLERKLSEDNCVGEKRVEVLNFGVAGYSTGQELLLLRKDIWNYHPGLGNCRDVSGTRYRQQCARIE